MAALRIRKMYFAAIIDDCNSAFASMAIPSKFLKTKCDTARLAADIARWHV
jgi:hypothetical protein